MNILPISLREGARKKNIVIPLFQKEPLGKEEIFSYLPAETKTAAAALAKEEFRADEGETKSAWFSEGAVRRLRLFGLGEKKKWNQRKMHLFPRSLVRYAKGERITECAATLPSGTTDIKNAAMQFAREALAAHFEYVGYKEIPPGGWPRVKTVFLSVPEKDLEQARKGIAEGMVIGEEINACRNLSNTPGSDMTPELLAHEAREVAKKTALAIRVLEERDMKKLGMGGVLGVARGSDEKPKFIILEYRGQTRAGRGLDADMPKQKPLVLAGKGVTFDTGGLNIKPDQYMYEMHMDMSGGAAVIHGISAIARLKLPVPVVALVPAVENMPSGSSYRPGDLLKSLAGKTIEVLNTDAEGRIILADALWYGHTTYKPGFMIDFATLTGAAHVALGNYASALFTNRESLQQKLTEIGLQSGDYVWPLPLWDEYLADIKGTFGDLANTGTKQDRYGGAIHAAKFLEQFVENTPWAHLDIAPRMTTIEADALAKGASGVGVRYIVELAKQYPTFKL